MFFTRHKEMYSEERLKPLRTYRYQAVDKSFISRYILCHYWNWAVTLFPLWMAPNLITLMGLSFMLAALCVVYIFTPDLVGPGPSWIYFFFAFCLWIYSTLDNVDGKQARRTGSSSPLGELFDHGIDALNCGIGGLVQVAAMGLGSSHFALLTLGLTFWAFYLPTWEEYHTGVLYLGYLNGPTEGLLGAITLMIISGIYGPGIWFRTFSQQFPSLHNTVLSGVPISSAAIVFYFTIFLTIYIPVCILAVYRECQRKGTSISTAMGQLLPMLAVSIATVTWLYSPYSHIRRDHFGLFTLAFGVAFGKMATKIIYAHLTKRHFPLISGLMLPLFAGCILVYLPLIFPQIRLKTLHRVESVFLWSWFLVALAAYLNWSWHVIDSFCQYLDIWCFAIKPKAPKGTSTGTSPKLTEPKSS